MVTTLLCREITLSIISNVGPNYQQLSRILSDCEDLFNEAEKNLIIKGKTLEVALKEQATWQCFYAQKRIELKTLIKHLEMTINKIRGKKYIQFNENYSRSLGERAIEKYIDTDADYISVYETYLEVQEMFEKFSALVDAFTSRGYALRNITQARVSEINDVIL